MFLHPEPLHNWCWNSEKAHWAWTYPWSHRRVLGGDQPLGRWHWQSWEEAHGQEGPSASEGPRHPELRRIRA